MWTEYVYCDKCGNELTTQRDGNKIIRICKNCGWSKIEYTSKPDYDRICRISEALEHICHAQDVLVELKIVHETRVLEAVKESLIRKIYLLCNGGGDG